MNYEIINSTVQLQMPKELFGGPGKLIINTTMNLLLEKITLRDF